MAPEEHNPKSSSTSSCAGVILGGGVGGGGGSSSSSKRSSKRLKQKRIPQRGLGVAQLEKIRLEEQLKKEAPEASMEHPSNQSYYGNENNPLGNEEEKEIALKRRYSFALSISPPSPFPNCLPSTFVSQLSRSSGSASCGHVSLETNSKRAIRAFDCLDYSFLTLAPPTATPEESPKTTKEYFEDPIQRPNTSESSSESSGQQPFFYFLPIPNLENGQRIAGENNFSSREVGQSLDLNLKL